MHWYLVQLKPNGATIAARNLAQQDFAFFQPLERFGRRRGGRIVTATRPYFAGYGFVGAEKSRAEWSAIRSTRGVARLVSFGGAPAQVPEAIIEAFKAACDADGCVVMGHQFEHGDRVEIADGAFAGTIGQFDALAPDQRAWVLIDVIGKATRVSVGQASLTVAG